MSETNGKKNAGRPRKEIDKDTLRALAALQCTQEEILHGLRAAGHQLDLRTLKRRLLEPQYAEIIEGAKAEGRISLRRTQWRHSKMPNSAGVQMTIHLSKHHLGETDKAALELTGRVDATVEVTSARERVERKLGTLRERIHSRIDRLAVATGAKPVPARAE